MYRNVVINVPMFIGIILLIAVVTGILVYGIQSLMVLRDENNNRINSELENLFNIESHEENQLINENNTEFQNIVK